MLKISHILIFHLVALDYEKTPFTGTLKKYKGGIFSECCTKIFKTKFLRYFNEVLFKMVKTALKDAYLGGTTPTALQNEVSTCRKLYYGK